MSFRNGLSTTITQALLTLAILVAAAAYAPLARAAGAETSKLYIAPDQSFSVRYPATWKLITPTPGGALVAFSTADGKGRAIVQADAKGVVPPGSGGSFAELLPLMEQMLSKAIPGFKMINKEVGTAGKSPCMRLTFETSSGGARLRVAQCIADDGKRPLQAVASVPADAAVDVLEGAQAFASSFAVPADTATPAAATTDPKPATEKPAAASDAKPGADKPPATGAAPTATKPGAPGAIEWVRFEAPDAAFAISYPKGWEKAENAANANLFGNAAAIFTNAAEPGGQPDMLAVATAAAAALEQVPNLRQPNAPPVYRRDLKAWNKNKKEALKSRKGFKLVSENQATINGVPGLRLVYDANDEAGNTQRWIQIFFEKGQTEYQISYVTDPRRFAKFLPLEQAMNRSFVIAPKPGDPGPANTTVAADPAPAATTPEKPATTTTDEKPAAPAGSATAFESAELGVKLSYPSTWAPRKSTAGGILMMLLPAQIKPGARPSTITLSADPYTDGHAPNFKELIDAAVATSKATAPDSKVIESADAKIGRVIARRITIGGHNSVTKAETRAMYLFVPHANNLITLTGSAADDFNSLKESFDAIVGSIELAQPAQPKKAQ